MRNHTQTAQLGCGEHWRTEVRAEGPGTVPPQGHTDAAFPGGHAAGAAGLALEQVVASV